MNDMEQPVRRKLRLGVVGGGPGSHIGETHRRAAQLDGRYELVTGVFATDANRSRAFAERLGIAANRRYGAWAEMAEQEARRDDGIEVVAIMTPNNSHYAIAKAFLQGGVDVICDKPLTNELAEALELQQMTRACGRVFGVTFNYTGYPMVRQARAMVHDGELGEVRLVQVEIPQGWAATLLEAEGHKQATWRTTPAIAGKSTVMGDLGTHAHHLARYVTGLEVSELAAELATLAPGRQVDDNGHVMLRFSTGARGLMWVSMVAVGSLHGMRIRVYGDKASLEWQQEQPNELIVRPITGPQLVLARGSAGLSPLAKRATRLWPGHPEGFMEAFANLYTDIADAVLERRDGVQADPLAYTFPTVADGVLGVRFVEAAVESHRQGGRWVDATLKNGNQD